MDKESRKELRDYAWNYFALHAEQRMTIIRFFLIITSIILAGYVGLKKIPTDTFNAGLLPLTHSLITFIFWRLERRTRQLIHNAEEAIKELDDHVENNSTSGFDEKLKIFEKDEEYIINNKKWYNKLFLFSTYSSCLNFMFLIIGIGSLALTLYEYGILDSWF